MYKKGFTLVELVIVIVVLGILAAIAMPKFVDIVIDAKKGATQAGLGAIRSVIALQYSKYLATSSTTQFPSTIAATDFFDGKMPINKLNNSSALGLVAALPVSTATSANGWWYNSTSGQAGAYSDGTVDTSVW